MKNILEELGVSKEELAETAFKLYVPHGLSEKEAREKFKRLLEKQLSDVNVRALLQAGLSLNREFSLEGDPVCLVADEILGMGIADYIAGSRGVFEFVRYDKAKPGVLGKLPPFLDDVVGGLIAGIMSRIYRD
jgi:alpha-ribazole phosphatase CobZ